MNPLYVNHILDFLNFLFILFFFFLCCFITQWRASVRSLCAGQLDSCGGADWSDSTNRKLTNKRVRKGMDCCHSWKHNSLIKRWNIVLLILMGLIAYCVLNTLYFASYCCFPKLPKKGFNMTLHGKNSSLFLQLQICGSIGREFHQWCLCTFTATYLFIYLFFKHLHLKQVRCCHRNMFLCLLLHSVLVNNKGKCEEALLTLNCLFCLPRMHERSVPNSTPDRKPFTNLPQNETCQKPTQLKFVKLMRWKEFERAAAGRPDDGVNGRRHETDCDRWWQIGTFVHAGEN